MKIGRNQPCPCGSGAKYKRCHLIVVAPNNPEPDKVIASSKLKARAALLMLSSVASWR